MKIASVAAILLVVPSIEAFLNNPGKTLPVRSSEPGRSQCLRHRATRGAITSAPRMAISHAAAEEISNKDDVPKIKDPVSLVDFEALDIRVGRIVLAEPVPDPEHDNKPSRKYLSLVVDLGNEKRRVVSAVRSIVDVDDAIGKSVLIAANVEEETILGLPSRGRLLSGSNFSKEPMPRTLRTVLLGGGGVPPGSAVTGL